jgi:hypothetical protein
MRRTDAAWPFFDFTVGSRRLPFNRMDEPAFAAS